MKIEHFFDRLFKIYDLRFPFRADHLTGPRRVAWKGDSPFFSHILNEYNKPLELILGYVPRIGD